MNISSIFNKSNYMAFFKTAKETNLSTLFYRSLTTIKDAIQYPKWFQEHLPSKEELERQRDTHFSYSPLISIVVPTYCTPIAFLHEMIHSVTSQTYSNWELCIADASPVESELRSILSDYSQKDTRIKVTFLPENEGISGNTNHALAISTGEYIGLLDHDDILAPNALFEIVLALNNNPSIDIIYTDEDKMDSDSHAHYYPNFKPDYNQLLLQSCNYICHFFVFKRSIYEAVGLFDSSYDGSQDYNYILRTTRIAKCIHHIPKMLYHWRVHKGSVAGNPAQKEYCYDAAKRSLQADLDTKGIAGTVGYSRLIGFYDTTYPIPVQASIVVISFRKKLELEDWPNYNVKIVYPDSLQDMIATLKSSSDKYCIILDQNIPTLSRNALEQTIAYLQLNAIGAVAYKLVKGSKIQSIGMTMVGEKITGCYHSVPWTDAGFYGRALLDQYVPLCSPAAFACKRESLVDFFTQSETNSVTSIITTLDDLAVAFSLHLQKNDKYIAGMANVILHCKNRKALSLSHALFEQKREELEKASKLYSVPPY